MSKGILTGFLCLLTACDAVPTSPEAVQLEPVTVLALSGVVGQAVEPVPVVRLVTASGSPVQGVTVSFTVDGGGLVGRRTVESGADGTATPGSWILGASTGMNALTATVTPLAGQVVFTATGGPGPVAAVWPAGGDLQAGRAGHPLPIPLSVRVTDAFGNGVPGVPVTFEVTEGGGTITGGAGSTSATGDATSGPWILGPTHLSQAVRATAAGMARTFTARSCTPGTGATLTYIAGGVLQETNPDDVCLQQTLRQSGMERVREVAWSPDGRMLAFELAESDGWYGVFLSPVDTWRPARLAARFSRPSWSPDGSKLAVATGDCVYTCDLYTVNPDPASPDRAHLRSGGYSPAWSPDGSRIAYVRMSGDDGYHALHVMNADGSSDREIVPVSGPAFDHPSWSPDGQWIVVAMCQGTCGLFVVAEDGSGLRRLLPDDGMHSPTWSRDGRWIAFTWIREAGASYVAYVGPGGGTPVVVGRGRNPAWRPVGSASPVQSHAKAGTRRSP